MSFHAHRAATAAALLLASSAFAAGNLVTDGSFEDALETDGQYGFYAGNALNGWTAQLGIVGDHPDNHIEVRNDIVGTAQDGVRFVELDSLSGNSAMSQTLATVAGQTYTLSFWYSNRAQSDLYNNSGSWPGTVIPDWTNGLAYNVGAGWVDTTTPAANTTPDNQWIHVTTTFVATGATTLSFAATGASDTFGSALDNISVTTAVPEPATAALMGLGLLGLVATRRRNRG